MAEGQDSLGRGARDAITRALDAAEIGIAVFDGRGGFVACNERYRERLPGGPAPIPGTPYGAVFQTLADTALDPSEAGRLTARPPPGSGGSTGPQLFQCRDGRWLELDEQPADDGGSVCLWTDVTRRLDAETEVIRLQARLRDAIQSLPDGFALFDAEDRLDLHNTAFAGRYGLPPGESLVGLPYRDLLVRLHEMGILPPGPDDPAERDRLLDAEVERHRTPGGAVERRLADGRWMRVAETRTQDGGIVGIHADVSMFKRREAELAHRTALLDAVTLAATRIVGRGDWQSGVDDLLGRLGRALRVERASLYRVAVTAGAVVQICRNRWPVPSQAETDRLDTGDGALDGWTMRLRRGDTLHGLTVDLAGPLRTALERRGAVSHLAVPIVVGGEWWGHLAFDHSAARTWTHLEMDVLKTAATLLASAIQRARLDERLHHSEARKQAIVETALDCILAVDAEGRLVEFNPAAERTLGWSRDEAIGRPMDELIVPAELRAAHRWGLARDATVGGAGLLGRRMESVARRRDGSTFPCELSITPTRVGDDLYFTAYLRDITQRREAEEALVQAKTRAEAAARAKSAFLNTMSHELRTPLNAIIGFSEIIREEVMGPLGSPKYREFAADIHESGSHLLRIITDVLDMSRIEAGEHRLFPEPIDLAMIVQSCQQMLRDRAAKAGVALIDRSGTGDEPPVSFRADRRAVMKILLNLLSNAIKFTPSGGTATVSAEAGPHGWAVLRVSDTGIGIAPEALARVFEPFQQADSGLNRQHEGAGLGLTLSRALVELHGGTIEIASTVGQGTTVTLRFPPGQPD